MTEKEKQMIAAAKADLSGYRLMLEESRAYQARMAEVRAQAVRLTQSITGMPSGGTPLPGAQAAIEQLEQLAGRYAQHIRKLDRQTLHILTVLERIENPVHRQLLCNVYMDGMSIKRACFAVDRKPGNHYSYDWMRHLHRNALLSYGKALDNA